MKLAIVAATALMATLSAPIARACSYGPPPAYDISSDEADTTPPSVPTARVKRVERGHEGTGCGSTDSCDDVGKIELTVSSKDDVSGDDLGYVVEISGDEDERDVYLGTDEAFSPYEKGKIVLRIPDDDGRRDVRASLRIWSVDHAGNMSAGAAELVVRDDGDGVDRVDCSTQRPGRGESVWLPLLLLGLFARSRLVRARARRTV